MASPQRPPRARGPKVVKPRSNPLGRPPAGDSAETRARILRVARAEFRRYGYYGTTTKLIAEGADLTICAVNYYFPPNQDLLSMGLRALYTTYNYAIEVAQTNDHGSTYTCHAV